MTTRKQLIIGKYTELEIELKKHIDATLFPPLQDIDVADLVYFVTLTFIGITTPLQFHSKVMELSKTNGVVVSDAVICIISPLIEEFVNWLRIL